MNLSEIPVDHIPGIGPARKRDLAGLGIHTVQDLLEYYPFRYEDRQVVDAGALTDGMRVTVRGVVNGPAGVRWKGNKTTLVVPFMTERNVHLTAVWFNQPYLKEQLVPGRGLTITGKYDAKRRSIVVSGYEWQKAAEPVHSGRVVPVYRVRGELTTKQLRSFIKHALDLHADQIVDPIPYSIRQKYRLLGRPEAIRTMHFPKDGESLKQARRRLVFEEFFLFQCKLQAFRYLHRSEKRGIPHACRGEDVQRFLAALPFALTDAQRRVCKELIYDLRAPVAMTRLLQGDVGSGKTVVAFLAMYLMKCDQYQSAMMVPTEILAEQHYREALKLLEPLDCKIGLLTGGLRESEKRELLQQIASGEVEIVIGTHALLEDPIAFRNLGLVVTDEQHRFGVGQRSLFRQKGHNPDVLFMSATPIPRTMAMTLFGDLDVSTLDQKPEGRIPVKTHWVTPDREPECLRFVRQELAKGRQAYIVCPLIEESEAVEEVEAATTVFARMQEELAGFQVGLMHGKLAGHEKERVMQAFVAGTVQALVTTTVIEVGVNVPNATVMVIYNADRFGLAQLHQLRGRVGRGEHASYCLLIANPQTQTGRERMRAMVETTDGFVLAEKDLQLRGPGEFFGFRQSGLPEFKLGDIVQDVRVMEVARQEVSSLLKDPSFWILPEYRELVDYLKQQQVLQSPIQD
jgi:ATP-dependent DNA helicase RecG